MIRQACQFVKTLGCLRLPWENSRRTLHDIEHLPQEDGSAMPFIGWVAVAALLLIIVAHALTSFQVARLRRSGRYPQCGTATMADVERLLKMDARVLAVRCYREIHGCSLRQANDAVGALVAKR
jgi:hypothetical protein